MPRYLCKNITNTFYGIILMVSTALAGPLEAPPGMFKDLDDKILDKAIIINGKQLFIDDYIIEEANGVKKVLNQPVKHPKNPLLICDRPWEVSLGYSSVIYDKEEGFYKMWYGARAADSENQALCYATSPDGLAWRKPVTTPWESKEKHNIVFGLTPAFNCAGVFKDPGDPNEMRRYKMLYSDYSDSTEKSASTGAAFSPDGIYWVPCPNNPLIPFSDSHCCPFWDSQKGRYVAYLRYGPPNTRRISRIESEDFIHWSPKVQVLKQIEIDHTFTTQHYQMEAFPYEGIYMGLVSAYHGEKIEPIPEEQKAWKDKIDVQLAFSRNGISWSRVVDPILLRDARNVTIKPTPETWERFTREAAFIPFGRHGQDWDWGQIYPLQAPLIVGDEIRIYYTGCAGHHRAKYHGDPQPPPSGIGLATLRLDGFVSVNAGQEEGILTTKPLVFIGDALEINANAQGGSIQIEALALDGKVIEGFAKSDCEPLTVDKVHHIVKWKAGSDCQLLQARPLRLKFYLKNAKLYSFKPRILYNHYIPSYD